MRADPPLEGEVARVTRDGGVSPYPDGGTPLHHPRFRGDGPPPLAGEDFGDAIMDTIKTPYRSLTVLAAAGSLLVSLAGAMGIAMDAATAAQAVDAMAQLASAAMAAVAIYGRLRATTRIARRR